MKTSFIPLHNNTIVDKHVMTYISQILFTLNSNTLPVLYHSLKQRMFTLIMLAVASDTINGITYALTNVICSSITF